MKHIYTLIHSAETIPPEEWDHEFFKILGYFSTKEKALKAIDHYRHLPGFKYYTTVYAKKGQDVERRPGFYVLKEPLGISFWEGGYSANTKDRQKNPKNQKEQEQEANQKEQDGLDHKHQEDEGGLQNDHKEQDYQQTQDYEEDKDYDDDEEDEAEEYWTRKMNLPYWLKNKRLTRCSLQKLQKLFDEKYGAKKYLTGLGSEFYLAKLYLEIPLS